MLDQLLECGRHLPVFGMVLCWTSPASWARLRSARRSFAAALGVEQLRELAAAYAWPELLELDLVTLSDSLFASREIAIDVDADAADDTELARCEVAFVAALLGRNVNQAQPGTLITPLMQAAEESHRHLCSFLLDCKADADSVSVGGATSLSLALDMSCRKCIGVGRLPSSEASGSFCCSCPRPAVAALLLRHTNVGLEASFAAAIRLSLQDVAYIPLVIAFVEQKGMPIETEFIGPDCRRGTALSVALERRVRPVEAPLVHRARIVAVLLTLRADPTRPGPYTAWWGGAAAPNLLSFAAANSNVDLETWQLLASGMTNGPAIASRE